MSENENIIYNNTQINNNSELNDNFISLSLKDIKYYKSLYNLIFLYKNELNNLFSQSGDINIKEYIDLNINEDNIKNLIKKIEKYITDIDYNEYKYSMDTKIKEKELFKLLKLFKKLIFLNNTLKKNIEIISNIDIFNQKTLMSDTSKNNIHKNKLHILDIFNLYQKKIIIDNKIILNDIIDKIISIIIPNNTNNISLSYNELSLSFKLIKLINMYIYKNLIIIDLFCLLVEKIKNIDNSIDDLIYISKENFKNYNIDKELLDQNIKINSNLMIELELNNKPSKKSKYILIKEYLNIVKNLNKFKFLKSYSNLNDLFKNYLDSKINNIKISNILNNSNISQIYKFAELYSKYNIKSNKEIIIIILECEKDTINYNITNLLNDKLVIDDLSGITNTFIKKTNTIVKYTDKKNTNKKELIDDNETYISNIKKIHIINSPHNINEKKNTISLSNIDYNIDIILIHTNDKNKFDIFTNKENNLKLKDVLFLFYNKPNYRIENYNNILENNILNQIEEKDILDVYYKDISFDINTYTPANSLEIKNNIINDIKNKIKLEFNLENKHLIIEQILDIMIDNISKFIKNKNKIEYNSEIYLTYFSNISNVINKFKKEIVDNYDENFISKIGEIVENIQSKIVKIDENILDKYYYSNMFKN